MLRLTHAPLLQTGAFPLQPPQHSVAAIQAPLQGRIVPGHPGAPAAPPTPMAPPTPAPAEPPLPPTPPPLPGTPPLGLPPAPGTPPLAPRTPPVPRLPPLAPPASEPPCPPPAWPAAPPVPAPPVPPRPPPAPPSCGTYVAEPQAPNRTPKPSATPKTTPDALRRLRTDPAPNDKLPMGAPYNSLLEHAATVTSRRQKKDNSPVANVASPPQAGLPAGTGPAPDGRRGYSCSCRPGTA